MTRFRQQALAQTYNLLMQHMKEIAQLEFHSFTPVCYRFLLWPQCHGGLWLIVAF